jgi:hypothetical protein
MSPADPRLGAAALGVEDPVQRIIAGLSARIASLEAQVRALQATPTIQQLTGAPTSAARDGTPAADTTGTGKFWLRINGTWRSVGLT